MRRVGLIVVSIGGLALAAQSLGASIPRPNVPLDKAQIALAQCTGSSTSAKQLVDVTFTLTNYADSGYIGAWALDTVNRHLRIWRVSPGQFCAQIADDGSTFVTLAGYGPTGLSYLPAGIKGTFDGGYIISGIGAKFVPRYHTSGDLGTFDAKCDAFENCKGSYPSWVSYFDHLKTGGFASWGWIYDAGSHGTWLDQDDVVTPHGGDIVP
jgi:hypothetical protein